MPKIVFVQKRPAFSLIELIIVIFILGMVIFLGIEGFDLSKPKPKPLSPLNLKDTIRNHDAFQEEATLVCVDRCSECYLQKTIGSPFVRYNHKVDLKGIQAYTIDHDDNLVELDYGRFKDKPICLVVTFYPNGSSTPIILENENGVYYLPSFFGKPQKFDSLEDAKEQWLKYSQLIDDESRYY